MYYVVGGGQEGSGSIQWGLALGGGGWGLGGCVTVMQQVNTRLSTLGTFFGIWGSSIKNIVYWDDIRWSRLKI